MPIFEYICRECDRQFEALVHGSTRVECPSCSGRELEKQLSVFAAAGKGQDSRAESSAAGCGTCGDPRGPGACSMN